ncbi:MAG: hypothetical protein ACLR5T_02970 [Veillonella sp.]
MIHTYDAQITIALEALCGEEKGSLLDYNYDALDLHLLYKPLWMALYKVNRVLI